MAGFPGLILTNAGRQLQAKAQIGQVLQFTRVALGSGAAPLNQELLTALVTEKKSLSIQEMEVIGDGTSRIRAIMTNEGVTEGFFVTEIGVFARDPDTLVESLYSYSNSGAQSDFMPAAGGATVVEQIFDLVTVIGNATNVTAVIDDYITIATKADIEVIRPYILPEGGTVRQLLRKKSNEEGDAEWFDPTEGMEVRVHSITEERIAVANQDIFNLASTITNGLAIYVNGARLAPSAWTALNAKQVKLGTPLAAGALVQFVNNDEVGTSALARVSLTGPKLVYPGTNNNAYVITDYDAFSTYNVTTTVGAVARTNENITLTIPAGAPTGNLVLAVTRNDGSNAFTVAVGAQSVAQPEVLNPANGATDVGESPTLTTGAFATYPAAADTHLNTDWQISTDPTFAAVTWQSLANAANKESIVVPSGSLAVNTTYYVRARHRGNALGASPWSANKSFKTSAQFIPTVVGTAYGGGFYAGKIKVGANTYALIVAPKSTEVNRYWRTDNSADYVSSLNDGLTNTNAINNAAHPAAQYCRSLTTGGFTDWYLPSRDELELLYRKFKPTTDANFVGDRITLGGLNGENANSVPAGTAYGYGADSPSQTSLTAFQYPSGAECFSGLTGTSDAYWSSTEPSSYGTTSACSQHFHNGRQLDHTKSSNNMRVRAVRRVLIP